MSENKREVDHHPFREICSVCWAAQEVSFDEPVWLEGRVNGPVFCSVDCRDEWVEIMEEREDRRVEEQESVQSELSWLSV